MTRAESNRKWRKTHPEKYEAMRLAYADKTREARRLKARKYRAENKEKHQAYRREYYTKNREKIREIARAYKYGLAPGEFERVFEAQGRCCGICGSSKPRGPGWHTDHDHDTNVFRGVLCKSCNQALGIFGDNLEGVLRVVAYLTRSK